MMGEKKQMSTYNNKSSAPVLEYPCVIDVKIFLKKQDDNYALVKDTLLSPIATEFVLAISDKFSRNGKYQSFSCRINAQSQLEMDRLYLHLSSHQKVVMVM